jgi:microcystin-dependent protein
MSWKKVGAFSRRPQFNYVRAPDATVDNVSVTHTIGGQLDLGEWSDASDNTRKLDVKNRIINVCDPSGPQDVATRSYVDNFFINKVGTGDGGTQTIAGPVGPRGPAGPAGPIGQTGPYGPIGPRGIPGEAGPMGRDGAFVGRGDTGSVGPVGPAGVTGPVGGQGERGPTGTQGTQGIQGSSGLLVYLNPAGDSLDDVAIADSFLMSTTNVNFTTRVMDFTVDASETKPLAYFWNLRSNITQAQTSIPGGEVWTLNLFAKPVTSADIQNIELKFKVFRVTSTTTALATSVILDTQSTAMPPVNLPDNVLSVGTVSSGARLSSNGIALYQMTLQVPFTDVADPNTYLQVQIYATNLDTERTHYCKLYFQNTNGGYTDPTTGLTYASTYSYVRTTFGAAGIRGAAGVQGIQGIQGVAGPQGAQGVQGPVGSQGLTGLQGPAGIQGPRGDAAGVNSAVQYKHPITGVLAGSQYLTFDASDNNGTVRVPNIVMAGSTNGSIITPHRVDVNDATDTSVAPVYLSPGAYGDTNYSRGFMTVGLKYNTGSNTVSKPSTSSEVNFGFQAAYGLQTVAAGATAIGPSAKYAYRLSRLNGGNALSAMEILQNGSRMNLNADRFLLSSSLENSNGAQFTLTDVAGPVYDVNDSFMLSTQVWNKPLAAEPYPVWMSCHQGTSTYGNTGAMIKMNPDEIVFMGAVKFMKGMSVTGDTVNMDTDLSGTVNIGSQSSFINIGHGSQITDVNIGNGLTAGTLNLGTGMTTGTINIGTASNGGGSVINLGGPGDTINMMGTTTYINTTNLDVSENLITLNKGASYSSTTIREAGIQLTRKNNAGADTFPGWVKTDASSNATTWEIVPPNHVVSEFAEIGNGLAVCNIRNAAGTETTYPVVGLRVTNTSGENVQNLVLQRDGNVGIGYSDARGASVPNFPSSKLHVESTTGNQITLGNGNDSGGGNYVRTFVSSPLSGNSNVILAVGRGSDTNLRAATPGQLTRGFRFAYMDSDVASSSMLTLACTKGGTAFATPNLTFFRSDGTALFTSNLCVDDSKYFRMYSSTFSVVSPTANLRFEVNGNNGAMRIGNGDYVTADASAGSLTLGSHIVLNNDSNITPNKSNRPPGRRGLLRFNDDNNSAEIFDGSNWADVGYYAGLPLGAIIAYPSDSNNAPNNTFLLCDGASVSRTTYADLYTLISTTYGSGNDSTTFKVPDIKGRVIVGKGIAPFAGLNSPGGQETTQILSNNLPTHKHPIPSTGVTGSLEFKGTAVSTNTQQAGSHSHSITDTGHSHNAGFRGSNTWLPNAPQHQYLLAGNGSTSHNQAAVGMTIDTAGAHTHAIELTASGDVKIQSLSTQATDAFTSDNVTTATPISVLQPYIVLNYFIKATKESKRYNTPLISDIRVKCNINAVNSKDAIESIRLLQPKRYEYIDKNISNFTKHIGFIAQEAKMCIPESVITKKEFIPNIYSMAKLTLVSTNADYKTALLTSTQKPITTLICDELLDRCDDNEVSDSDSISIKNVKLKIFNRSKECFYVYCTESVDEYNIMVQISHMNQSDRLLSDDYFVYGQEIDDYHYMNNDAVFSTLVSAFQQLDKKVNQQDALIEKLLAKLQQL